MVLQYPSIALLLTLLAEVPFANGGGFRAIITRKDNVPILQATTSSSQQPSALPSSYSVTFTPVVPNGSTNKYIYHSSQRSGTVFIAAGTCIGVIILTSFGIWLIFAIRAWKSAREEYKLRELKNKCQYDPLFFAGEPDLYDNATDFSDTGDSSSDISEEVLKTKTSGISIYNLGSTSALNLLNQVQPPSATDTTIDPNASFVNSRTMFISPTETLKNEGNSRSTWNPAINKSPLGSDKEVPDSNTPTSKIHAPTQTIEQCSTCTLPTALKNNTLVSIHSTLDLSSPYAILTDINGNDNINTNQQPENINKVEDYRPPSAHLDALLDHSLLQISPLNG